MGEDASFFEKLLGPDDMAQKLGVVIKEVALLQTAYIAQVSSRLSRANRQFSLYQAQAGKTMEWAVDVASEWKGDLQARKISEGEGLANGLEGEGPSRGGREGRHFRRIPAICREANTVGRLTGICVVVGPCIGETFL